MSSAITIGASELRIWCKCCRENIFSDKRRRCMNNNVPRLINDLQKLGLDFEVSIGGIRLKSTKVQERSAIASKVLVELNNLRAWAKVLYRILRLIAEWAVFNDSIVVSISTKSFIFMVDVSLSYHDLLKFTIINRVREERETEEHPKKAIMLF